MKLLILLLLLVILGSLAASMIFIVRDRGRGKRPVAALTVRVVLSLVLFALLVVGYFTGHLKPHGIIPPPPTVVVPGQSQSQ